MVSVCKRCVFDLLEGVITTEYRVTLSEQSVFNRAVTTNCS